jgi:hypothetical protein
LLHFSETKNPFSSILSLAACENSFTDFSIKNMQGGGYLFLQKIYFLVLDTTIKGPAIETMPAKPEFTKQ